VKSVIDWNEMVPLLPKPLQETLVLEAAQIMMRLQGALNAFEELTNTKKRRRRLAPVSETTIKRQWLREGDGKTLAAVGRRYHVMRGAKRPPSRGKIGLVWKKLAESSSTVITYEGIASICKGVSGIPVSAAICALWERGFIDVAPPRTPIPAAPASGHKVGEAY